jgi:cephalosporin-C deacetylase-like acetyl esterase
MKHRFWIGVLLLAGALSACSSEVQAPDAVGPASPEAVALSLSTVDPAESLGLFEYDHTSPLDIQEERRWQQDGAQWIDFTYASPLGGRVPARLVIPRGAGPFPGLILQHGGPGTLEDMDGFAREFARYGAVTIMITSPYRRPGGWFHTQYMGNTWPMFTRRDLEIKIQTILDLRRAVDILEERPEVDPDRLAYFGVSWGGSMGGLLAGVENRLKAYVLVVGDGGLVEHTADSGPDGLNIHFSAEWAAMMWPTEPLHFVGRAAPAALLFQNGLYDTFVPPSDALRFYTAASEPKTIIWYDAGHELPWSFVEDAADWLQPYLGDRLLLLAPNYRPSAVFADRALLAAAVIPLGIFLVDGIRRRRLNWRDDGFWPLVILLLGPLGLGIFWLAGAAHDARPQRAVLPQWRTTLWISTRTTVGLVCGLWIGDRINEFVIGPDFRIRFLEVYLAVLLLGWASSLIGRKKQRISFPGFVLVANAFWALAELLPMIFYDYFRGSFWLRYPASTALGILVAFPLHRWLLRNGWALRTDTDEVREARTDQSKAMLAVLLAASFAAALGIVVLIVHRYSGLSWGESLGLLFGISE